MAENTARIWQRGATRRAILDAARLVAARTGSTEFSLNTVAKEAGYSTTTVFAYFPTKNDLFLGIVADDLASLARTMREGYAFDPQTEDAPAAEFKAEAEAPPAGAMEEQPQDPVAEAQEVSSVVAFAPPSESKTETAKPAEPPRVDAWLERRLRVFEKTLGDLETRLASVQRESADSAKVVQENTKIFGERLESSEKRVAELSNDLSTRMSAAEKRLRDAQGDLRNSLLNASMRLDQLEAAAKQVAGAAGYTPPVEFVPAEREVQPEEAPAEKPLTAAADTYLSAARRAAQTAAKLAHMEQEHNRRKNDWWLNRRMGLMALGVALAFIVGALASYAMGERIGRATPVRVIVPRDAVQNRNVEKTAALTPLDRLSSLANRGDATAQLLIGLRYHQGDGIAANQREAAKWISRSAAANNAVAQYWLAALYRNGEGVPADLSQALVWDKAAAAQGNRQAMHDLGVAYAEGLGAQKDFAESARWFTKAATLGLTNSQFNLAVLYERGEGVSQSLTEAYKWYALAAAHGDTESGARVEAIAAQMTPGTLAAAKEAVASFKPDPMVTNSNTIAASSVQSVALSSIAMVRKE